MRKIVVLYCNEKKYNNVQIGERLVYELAHNVLYSGDSNGIVSSERITREISRVQFKDGTDIVLYPISDYGLTGMKFTDVYIDDDIRYTEPDARMYMLTKIMPSLLDDRLTQSLYDYDKPIEERLKTFKLNTHGGDFTFLEFMKQYGDDNNES